MASTESRVERIQKHFKSLAETASTLNTASDELTKAVAVLDDSLKKLNIGLEVWVTFSNWADPNDEDAFDNEQIGYCKVNGTWGLSIRRIWGDERSDVYNVDGPWLFHDASRENRLSSVDKMPELFEALSRRASDAANKVQEKAKQVRDLAEAVTSTQRNAKSKDYVSSLESMAHAVRLASDQDVLAKAAAEIARHASKKGVK